VSATNPNKTHGNASAKLVDEADVDRRAAETLRFAVLTASLPQAMLALSDINISFLMPSTSVGLLQLAEIFGAGQSIDFFKRYIK
jgi:hypothetical protein